MILICAGSNLFSRAGHPADTVRAAFAALDAAGISVAARSRLYRTSPVPASDQPDFVNAAARLESDLAPLELLDRLLEVERSFGRERRRRWDARTLDLDLVDCRGTVIGDPADEGARLVLPHPRVHERAFMLLPLADVAPDWRHPVTGRPIAALLKDLEPYRGVRQLEGAA